MVEITKMKWKTVDDIVLYVMYTADSSEPTIFRNFNVHMVRFEMKNHSLKNILG